MFLLSCCPFWKTTVNLFIKTRTKGKSGCRSVVKNIKNADLELKENQAIEAWLKILKTRIRKYVRLRTLLRLHASTGCNTVSAFSGKTGSI